MRTLSFAAIVLTALALVPAGAHLFELPNKMGLDQAAYFTVQQIYRGWALFGFLLIPALLVDLALAIALRRRGSAFLLALVGFALMAATLLIFFVWTFPANQLTSNWRQVPPNWAELRRQWEYTHATAAVLTFLALCAVTAASLRGRGTD